MAEATVRQVNVDIGCSHKCELCERFFDCGDPEKEKIYNRGRMALARRTMARIKYKIAVAGGKGGTGKSTMAANIAMGLALLGRKVSVLDQDLDGSTIPKLFGVMHEKLRLGPKGIVPVEGYLGVQLVSLGFVQKEDEVITLFHPMRRGATEEFLSHVDYGERDYLVVDLPPGTSSDAVNLMQYIPDITGTVVVTAPSTVSQMAARRAALLSLKAGVRVIGIIENMSGYVCARCGSEFALMRRGGGKQLAEELGVPFLGAVPLHPEVSYASDRGTPFVQAYPDNPASQAVTAVARKIDEFCTKGRQE